MGIRPACRVAVFGFAALSLPAEWIKLTTPHFEMYTTNTRAKAIEAIAILEQARTFFDKNSPSETVTDAPIRIIAFHSEKEFRPYSSNPGAIAFYQRGHRRDYIVTRDLGAGSSEVVLHEYTHLYLEHRNLRLPLWLNEGLADVYSTLEFKDGQVTIGLPPAGRLEALRTLPLLKLPALFSVEQTSGYYRNPAQMRQFYAESWALAHMLLLSAEYRDDFRDFLRALNNHTGTEESFREVYGKSLSQVAADLENYVSQAQMTLNRFDARSMARDVPEVSEPKPREVELVLADLLSSGHDTAAQAQARLTGLAAESPKDPEVQKSLGYAAWEQGKLDDAKEHFKEAIQDGSTDALMIFQYATLLHMSGAPPAQVIPLLQRALELKPDLADARFSLGMEAATQGECQVALSAFSQIKSVSADRAYPLYLGLAFCTWKEGNSAEARHWAALAKHYAATPQQSANVTQLLDELDRARP